MESEGPHSGMAAKGAPIALLFLGVARRSVSRRRLQPRSRIRGGIVAPGLYSPWALQPG